MASIIKADTLQSTTANVSILNSSGTEYARFDSSGKMGIGTASPGAKLDVRGSSTFLINAANPTAWVSSDSGLTTQSMYMQVNTTSSDTRLGSYTSHPLVFLTNNAERMRIDSSGNVGIGTSSPAANSLTIASKNAVMTTGYGMSWNSGATQLAGYDTNVLQFITASTERMRIDSSGNVGIGTNSPSGRLNLAVGASTSCVLRFTANGTGAGSGDRGRLDFYSADNSGTAYQLGYMDYDRSDGTGTASYIAFANRVSGTVAERMRIDSSGNLLVGTTSQVSQGKGNIAFNGSSHQGLNLQEIANQSSAGFMYFQYNTTLLGTITRNVSTNAVLYNTTSDIRLKENIENANSALTTISNIKVRQYDWIGCENSHQDYGFIAQELAEVVSGIVTKGRTEEDTWAVDYGKLTPILCKAIQEQQALITQLQADVAALKAK